MNLYKEAQNLGILTEFVDGQGERRVTDETALKIIIDALPTRMPHRLVEGTVVVRQGQPARTELAQTAALPLRWTIDSGPEIVARGETRDRTILWPQGIPVGTYRLQLTDAGGLAEEVPLIVAPPRAFGGDFD